MNLGDTSFLDAIAFPGWGVEEIGQGVHDNKTFNGNGQPPPQDSNVVDANLNEQLVLGLRKMSVRRVRPSRVLHRFCEGDLVSIRKVT
jgi:hypothetical protein